LDGQPGTERRASPPDGRRLPEIKDLSSVQLVLNRAFAKLSHGFTSLPALLKDVKISNHHKVNISKRSLFKNHSHFQKSLEFHPRHPTPSLSFCRILYWRGFH
jgi:hypothetical protein